MNSVLVMESRRIKILVTSMARVISQVLTGRELQDFPDLMMDY